jgi:hypothetical protein
MPMKAKEAKKTAREEREKRPGRTATVAAIWDQIDSAARAGDDSTVFRIEADDVANPLNVAVQMEERLEQEGFDVDVRTDGAAAVVTVAWGNAVEDGAGKGGGGGGNGGKGGKAAAAMGGSKA